MRNNLHLVSQPYCQLADGICIVREIKRHNFHLIKNKYSNAIFHTVEWDILFRLYFRYVR